MYRLRSGSSNIPANDSLTIFAVILIFSALALGIQKEAVQAT